MLEMIKSQWYFWISWVTSENVYNAGIEVAIVFSLLCLGVMVLMIFLGFAFQQGRDGGIAGKCDNGKTLT